jgi:hypothetical protein
MAPDLKSFFRKSRMSDEIAYFVSDEVIDDFGLFDKKMVKRFLRKFSAGIPEKIGYRDNMLITFILSAHMACYWSRNPRLRKLSNNTRYVRIVEAK